MSEEDKEAEIKRLKKMSKELWGQKEEYKKKIKFLEDRIFKTLERHKFTTVTGIEKTLITSKIVNELISSAGNQLLVITPYIDSEYTGTLMQKKSEDNVDIILVTKELSQIKTNKKEIKQAIKLLKGFDQIQHIEILFANSLLIIKDQEEALISTGVLTKDNLEISYNLGLFTKEKDDIKIFKNFFQMHVPKFMKI
ncbi:MAG: hypothetical protein GF329_13895 [Candidatus Lokiarchaeota archaeon]|nr:hypothetical protein [Candidatus Lokiarchaeota archaeon]